MRTSSIVTATNDDAIDNGQLVRTAFAAWETGDSRPFFALVEDNVTWTVIGSTPVSGTHTSKEAFLAAAGLLFDKLDGPIIAKVDEVITAGNRVVLRWAGTGMGRNGRPYDQTYCWVLGLTSGRITDVVAYLDTEMVDAMFAD